VLRDRVLEPFGIVIEFDGRLGHSDPTGRLRDNRRDNFVALTGRVPLRYGWQDVHERACERRRDLHHPRVTGLAWHASRLRRCVA
jgi:hypothetical protein